ncbi:MAG: hypothetical protein ACTSUO_09780 [Candidatus Thorarchaeota archaeon]
MRRRRGRPKRPLPIHPERVISIAMNAGLSSTVRLQRAIKNRRTRKHFENSDERWKIARQVYLTTKKDGDPDYSYILKAEPKIRDNMLKMLYEKAAEFGHDEVRRQKNSDDTVGPLNQRFNACGAALREFSECNFPFPDAEVFGTRTQKSGLKKREFRIAGYNGTTFGPRVTLVHPDLPSLDFGDAVRSHNEVTAIECAICDVPVKETTRYSNLFLLLARPYLENIYSEYKCGRSGFRSGVSAALRHVKNLITESGYQPTMYLDKSVTGVLEYESGKTSMEFFDTQLDEANEFYGNHPVLQELKRLKIKGFERSPGAIEPCLTESDVIYIRQKAIRRGRLKGSIMHRRIGHLFPSPWSLQDVIYNEHKYTGSSDYVIVSELPVQTNLGKGKVDITLFERMITKDGKRALHRPAFTCEIKTRMGHEWNLDSELKISQSRGRDGIPHRVIPEFPINDRPMDEREWKSIVDSTPYPKAQKQVSIYADALAQRYHEITGEDSIHIYRATIMIEAISDINHVRNVIEGLVIKAYEFLKKNNGSVKRMIITPTNVTDCNIVLVIHKQKESTKISRERIKTPWHPSYNPFQRDINSNRRFILYLTGESPTSAGTSAAWNAKYYHGLKLLYEIKKKKPNTKFLWLDLASQFTNPLLAEARLRLRPRRFTEEEESKAHHENIREFFETIEVKSYLDSILSSLYDDGSEPSFNFKYGEKPVTIIVSGVEVLTDATPKTHRNQLQLILDKLLTSLPDREDDTILWLDSPVPSVDKSIPYATRALLPYYASSTLAEHTTEIIWNLPSPPNSAVEPEKWTLGTIGDSPMFDDLRMIVYHSPKELDIQFESIPLLQGWSKRFKNQGRGLVVRERNVTDIVPEKDIRDRIKLLALTMIPWIVDLYPDMKLTSESDKTLKEQFSRLIEEFRGTPDDLEVSIVSTDKFPSKAPTILNLMRFRQSPVRSGKAYVATTIGRINSQRLYRSPLKLMTTPRQAMELSQEDIDTPILESGWSYGIKFVAGYDLNLSWWMIIQDPRKPSRMLVGCFLNKIIKKGEFHWSETKSEILTGQSVTEILEYKQLAMWYRTTEQGVEVWNDKGGFEGLLEVKSQGYSSVSHLRATRFTEGNPTDSGLQPDISFPTSIHQRITDALKRYCDKVASPIPVKVKLERREYTCKALFIDENDDILQEVELETVFDLQTLLRWPMIHGGPMNTDVGEFVTWNIFEDIDYSDMNFIRPYIIYRTTRTAPKELPSRISQFYGPSEEVVVEIEHDRSVCPLALEEGDEHGECWRILLHESTPKSLRNQLENRMTGRMVHGFLAPGRIWSKKLFELKIIFNYKLGTTDCFVFQEEDWIRRVLREQGIVNLPSIPLGSYLRAKEEKWIVDILIDDRGVIWNATSTVTGRRYNRYTQIFKLDFTNKLENEHKRILEIITKNLEIVPAEISNLGKVEKHVTEMLEEWGFDELSPPCELFVELLSSGYSLNLKLKNEYIDYEILKETFQIDRNTTWEIIKEMFTDFFNEGWLSQFNIVNSDDVEEQFNKVQELLKSSDEDEQDDIEEHDDEDSVLLNIIVEYREEVVDNPEKIRYMCGALLQLTAQKIEAKEFDEAIGPLDESIRLLLECDMHNSSVRKDLRKGILLLTDHYSIWPDNALRLLKSAQRKFKLLLNDKFSANAVLDLHDLIETLVQKVGE